MVGSDQEQRFVLLPVGEDERAVAAVAALAYNTISTQLKGS
jgi:hypothetical protein